MHPRHVKEAFRLLSKSIIRVETPDINFDEPDLLTDAVAMDAVNGEWSYVPLCVCVCTICELANVTMLLINNYYLIYHILTQSKKFGMN